MHSQRESGRPEPGVHGGRGGGQPGRLGSFLPPTFPPDPRLGVRGQWKAPQNRASSFPSPPNTDLLILVSAENTVGRYDRPMKSRYKTVCLLCLLSGVSDQRNSAQTWLSNNQINSQAGFPGWGGWGGAALDEVRDRPEWLDPS